MTKKTVDGKPTEQSRQKERWVAKRKRQVALGLPRAAGKPYGRRPAPYTQGASTQVIDASLHIVERNKVAREELKNLTRAAQKRALERSQFQSTDQEDISRIIKANRQRTVATGNDLTPLNSQLEVVLGKDPFSDRSNAKAPTQKHAIDDTRTQSYIEQQVRFGESRKQIIAGWQLAAEKGECLPVGQCVYLIYGAGLYKIGHTKGLAQRLAAHRLSSPAPLILTRAIVCFDGFQADRNAERCIHATFFDKRCHGEWFALSDEDLNYLDLSCKPWLVKYAEPRLLFDNGVLLDEEVLE